MSDDDDLQITYGGAIAVNTETLRDVAFRLGPIGVRIGQAADAVYTAHRHITGTAGLTNEVNSVELWAVGDRLAAMRVRIDEVVTGTLLMADAYELVELRTEYEARYRRLRARYVALAVVAGASGAATAIAALLTRR